MKDVVRHVKKIEENKNIKKAYLKNLPSDTQDYFKKLSEAFTETTFNPYEDVWEEKLRQILDKFETNDNDEKKE